MDTGSRAAAWAVERIGQGYIWGATGWVCSKARREAQAEVLSAHGIVTDGGTLESKRSDLLEDIEWWV